MKAGTFLDAINDKGRIGPMLKHVPVHIVLAEDLGRRGALLVACRLAKKPLKKVRASRALTGEDLWSRVESLMSPNERKPDDDDDEDDEEVAKAETKRPAAAV